MPRFTTLYSSSAGNCAVVEQNGQFILIDMGGSCKATCAGIDEMGLCMDDLQGVILTHEHSDHVKGLKVFLKRYNVPVWGSIGTLAFAQSAGAVPKEANLMEIHQPIQMAGFVIHPFSTSHDAAECLGFRLESMHEAGSIMAIATDLGYVSKEVMDAFDGVSLAVLEANYDDNMLKNGKYHYALKKRIFSQRGHLSNKDSAKMVAKCIASGAKNAVMCHLSKENNHPNIVQKEVEDALYEWGITDKSRVHIAERNQPGEWIEF